MKTKCPACNKSFEVPEAYVGRTAKCSGCKSPFVVGKLDSQVSKAATASLPAPMAAVQEVAKVSPKQSGQAWDSMTESARRQMIMSGFYGSFVKPKTAFAYRMGLMFSAGIMLLLPILYLAFIGGVGWLVWWHLSSNTGIITGARGRGAAIALAVYAAPAIVGVIAIVFMFKPIFARPAKQARTRSLTQEGEPMLFEFVRKICNDVGAPMPKRIDIDNEVNASASFRSGWWSILRGNDLVLTLGMPLVSGLSLQQLAGVLAHEFGHFSQGAGMRVSYVLRSINLWFVRAVYERDALDEWLASMSTELDLRISWIFYLARGAVFVSRGFLFVLLMIGNVLTGLIQQQMEFDADRYEVGMAGKVTFASTFERMRVLGVAYHQGLQTLGRIFSEGRLVTNFPKLAMYQAKKLPKEVLKKIDDSAREQKTGWFDSHPSDTQRIQAVQNHENEGAFRSKLPAQSLFVHFDAACDGVTMDMYKATFGREVSTKKLVPTHAIISEESVEDEAWDALDRFFCGANRPRRSFVLPSYDVFAPQDIANAVGTLNNARQWMVHSRDHYKTVSDAEEITTKKKRNQAIAERFKRRYAKMKEELLQIAPEEIPTSKVANPDPQLAQKFVAAATIRLHTACCLLQTPQMSQSIPNWSSLQSRVTQVLGVLDTLEKDLPKVLDFFGEYEYQSFCAQHFDSSKGDQDMLIREVLSNSQTLTEHISNLRAGWMHLRYPFEHADPNMTVGKHVATDVLIAEEVGVVLNAAETLIERYFSLRGRCLGHLAMAAEAVEKSLGLAPLEGADEKLTS